jgi:hypothetical protein
MSGGRCSACRSRAGLLDLPGDQGLLAAGRRARPGGQARALGDMRRFVEAGITTFDCADIYTGVEELIGSFPQGISGRLPVREPAAGAGPHQIRPRPVGSALSDQRPRRETHRPVSPPSGRRAARPRPVPLVGLRRPGLRGGRPAPGGLPRRGQDPPCRPHQFRRRPSPGDPRRRRPRRFEPGPILGARQAPRGRPGRAGGRAGRPAPGLRNGGRRAAVRPLPGRPGSLPGASREPVPWSNTG